METYVGIKEIKARPMTKGAFFDYMDKVKLLIDGDLDSIEGYLVEYKDGGEPNHSDHEGYISWSLKHVFEQSYRQDGQMTFSEALFLLKRGFKVRRSSWKTNEPFFGTDIKWVHLINMDGCPMLFYETLDSDAHTHVYDPKQDDLFAEDWKIVT